MPYIFWNQNHFFKPTDPSGPRFALFHVILIFEGNKSLMSVVNCARDNSCQSVSNLWPSSPSPTIHFLLSASIIHHLHHQHLQEWQHQFQWYRLSVPSPPTPNILWLQRWHFNLVVDSTSNIEQVQKFGNRRWFWTMIVSNLGTET